jgi:hypothetical protein
MSRPQDCTLTEEQWTRLLPRLQTETGWIWLPPDAAMLDDAAIHRVRRALEVRALNSIGAVIEQRLRETA